MGQYIQKSSMRSKRVPLAVLLGTMFFSPGLAMAEVYPEELVDLSAGALITQGTKLLKSEKYDDAVVYFKEYLVRMESTDTDRVRSMKQRVRLRIATILSHLEDYQGSIEMLEAYTQELPLARPREAYKLLTINYNEAKDYERCIQAAQIALTQPEPKGLVEKEKKEENFEDLSKDELGGLSARQLKRYAEIEAEAAKEGRIDLSQNLNASDKAEPEYTLDELILLNMLLAESCTKLEDWETSVKPYKFVVEYAMQEDRKGYATMQLVNSLINLERFEEVKEFILQLCETDARYDIRVNMALMKAASSLLEHKEFDSALMLYRMILPRTEMIAYQERKMNEIRQEVGLPDVVVTIEKNESGRADTVFGYKNSGLSAIIKAQEAAGKLPKKPMELILLEESVGELANLAPYEDDVLYRIGQLYASAGRPWEAVEALDAVVARDPDGERGQRAFAESLMVYGTSLKQYDLVEERALDYLAKNKSGLGPRMVTHALISSYQSQDNWEAVKGLLPIIKGFEPSDDKAVVQYECELYYLQAIADLMLMEYAEARKGFWYVLAQYDKSHQQQNSLYWHAMSGLFLQEYEGALKELTKFAADFPRSQYVPSVLFHSGICLFALERYDEAEQKYTEVIENYPEDRVYSDACSMRADLFASKGNEWLEKAQEGYEEAIRTAQTDKQDSYAVFQMAAMFEMEERYDEIIEVVNAYLARQDKKADVAKAAYWIGKTKLAQGLIDEAVAEYRKAIVRYGDDVQQDGVDMIITELVNVSARLDEKQLAKLEESLLRSVENAKNETLRLRLLVLLAKINDEELELGKELLTQVTDLKSAPPPVLAIICDASFAENNYSNAEEILKLFKTKFEDSDFMRSAYKLRGYDLYSQKEYDETLKLIKETQELYGTDSDAVWAQIMRGDIQFNEKELDAARETYRAVLNVRGWRGEPYAEANYKLGLTEEAAGEYGAAHDWFQRTYVQYKGYDGGNWAADAYLGSARSLSALGKENDSRNTYRAMLFDKYVNTLPQADVAKKALGAEEVAEINAFIESGMQTNIVVSLEAEVPQK